MEVAAGDYLSDGRRRWNDRYVEGVRRNGAIGLDWSRTPKDGDRASSGLRTNRRGMGRREERVRNVDRREDFRSRTACAQGPWRLSCSRYYQEEQGNGGRRDG